MRTITEEDVFQVEERLRDAMLLSDVTALDMLLAPDLIFTNHLGQKMGKEVDLQVHGSGRLKMNEITSSEEEVQLYENFAVVSMLVLIKAEFDGQALNDKLRFTRIWRISPLGELELCAGHSSSVI